MNTKFDEYFFQKLHHSLPLDVITFSEDGNKPSSDEDNKSVSDTDRINNCRRFSILCLQCLLRLSSMQKWVVLDVAFFAVWYLFIGHNVLYTQQI